MRYLLLAKKLNLNYAVNYVMNPPFLAVVTMTFQNFCSDASLILFYPGHLTNAFYAGGRSKMPPLLNSKPKVMRTPNLT